MASNINRVTLGGRLTRDPELMATASGRSVLSFCLAVGEDYKDQASGEWKERAHFVDCTIFGQRADSLNRIMVKGMKVTVEGRLRCPNIVQSTKWARSFHSPLAWSL